MCSCANKPETDVYDSISRKRVSCCYVIRGGFIVYIPHLLPHGLNINLTMFKGIYPMSIGRKLKNNLHYVVKNVAQVSALFFSLFHAVLYPGIPRKVILKSPVKFLGKT